LNQINRLVNFITDRGHFVSRALLQHVALEQFGLVPLVNLIGQLDNGQTFLLVDSVLLQKRAARL